MNKRKQMSKYGEQVGSIPLWPGLQFLPRAPILTSLHDGLRCLSVGWNKPFHPQAAFSSCFITETEMGQTVISSMSGTLRPSSFPKALQLSTVKLDTRIEQMNYRGGGIRFHRSRFRVFERTWFMWLKLRHNHASLGLHPLIISRPGHTHSISCFLFFSFQCLTWTPAPLSLLWSLCVGSAHPMGDWCWLPTVIDENLSDGRHPPCSPKIRFATWWGHPNHCWGEWAGKQSYKCVYVCVHYRRKILGEKVEFTPPSKQPTEMIWVYNVGLKSIVVYF